MTDLIGRTLQRLGQRLPGRISKPGDTGYDAATTIWAKPVGPLPHAVIHCQTPEDVQSAIRAARDSQLPLSVRGGGRDWAGRSLCAGIVIDLSGMNAVTLGADNRIARISGGARASDLLAVTDRLGLAAVTGSCGAVGMTGLTLGGGYGALIGRYGLTLDNLIAAEIVLADGHIVTAKRDCEEELFWALRGGGGNFGVVTSMQYRLHDLPSIRSGMLLFPFTEARAVLEGCADIAASAPDVVDIRISWLETTRTVWRKATVATSNGSSRQSGTTIPIASSPPFRCRQLSTGWPPNSPRAVEGNGCESPPFVTCPQIAKGP